MTQRSNGVVPGAGHAISLPEVTSWERLLARTLFRLDAGIDDTTWFVDGEETFDVDFQVPTNLAWVGLNACRNGDKGWTGGTTVGGRAYQYIQWIEPL
jgi:hypothetical protein